jgi:hypothetical protein
LYTARQGKSHQPVEKSHRGISYKSDPDHPGFRNESCAGTNPFWKGISIHPLLKRNSRNDLTPMNNPEESRIAAALAGYFNMQKKRKLYIPE